ncbi:MAG: CDF family Co(II)/Ni(II) efflux transporter DmeF [Thermodesulfobacteriota bacterium]
MHSQSLAPWRHDHEFTIHNHEGERRTGQILAITAVTMCLELVAGAAYGSMALLADGWHMGTHAAAFGIAIFAYRYARKHSKSSRFAFGPGKVGALGGFASAVALAAAALMMLFESGQRLISPQPIHFNEAIGVAALGLLVNLASALLLQDSHDHHHDGHTHHHHHDHNLRAAYLHVLADALTSLLAIIALLAGKYLGWMWLDPAMGIVGALVITRWAVGLLGDTAPILLDQSDRNLAAAIVVAIQKDRDNRVADLHVWRVGATSFAAIVSLVTHVPAPLPHYKQLLAGLPGLAHLTLEIQVCEGEPCLPLDGGR